VAGTFTTGSVLINPIATQRHLAAPSGGDVAMGGGGLDDLMASSSGWYRLSYQIDRPPDGANHAISVTSNRPGISIRTTSIIASETDEGAASARVRRLLRGSQEAGDLGVRVEVADVRPTEDKNSTAEATVTVDLTAIAALQMEGAHRNLRLSIGILPEGQAPFVMHRVESVGGVVAQWKYSVPLEWPQGGAQLAVVVEDLGSGAWGGTVTQLR
jgi:hypothetical protein